MELIKTAIKFCNRRMTIQPRAASSIARYSSKTGGGDVDWAADAPGERLVLTGLQPTGALHVGNYFAAVRRAVRLQRQGQRLMVCIADLHALTGLPQQGQGAGDGDALRGRVLDAAAVLLAAGVCPERGALWVQSAVPRHAELCWLLACLATQARLRHLPQYRERAAAAGEGAVPVGALLYPVLQAADVLLHRATHVPVGADQLGHLQLAQLLARTARHRLGLRFPEPQPLLPDDGSDRIRSLRDPTKKMSKSDPNAKSRIMLTDSDDDIRLKIQKAVTDFNPEVTYCPESRPGVSNLVRLHCLASGLLPEEAVEQAGGLTTARYKAAVAAALVEELAPVRERAAALRARPAYLRDVLRHGAARARRRADDTWARAAAAAGLDCREPRAGPVEDEPRASQHAVAK